MLHFNSDGGRARLCLNGTRCAARLAFHLGWATGDVVLLTDEGPIEAHETNETEVRLNLAPPETHPRVISLEAAGAVHKGWRVRVGVPHLVFLWQGGLEEAPVAELGRLLVHHPEIEEEGANVNFVFCPKPGRMEIRTYERGVYAETLACGTGVLASSLVLTSTGRSDFPMTVITAGGFELSVEGAWRDGHLERWSLAGDARLVAEGRLSSGAESLPAPPCWTVSEGTTCAPNGDAS